MQIPPIVNILGEQIEEFKKAPHCDLDSGEIYNCEKYSKKWWHEKGHIEFNKRPGTSALKMWQGIIELVWMLSITLAIYNKYMMWVALPMLFLFIGIDIYEERWANKYAERNFIEKKTNI